MVDASKGLRDQDRSMLQHIDKINPLRTEIQPVLTKVDLIPPEERPKIAEQIFEEIKKTSPWVPAPILTCSRKDNQMGIEEIRRSIAQAAGLPYEEAWVSRNAPRPKKQPLADATNKQDGDAADGAEVDTTAQPARPPRPERTRTERVERTERRASREGKEERSAQAGTDRPLWAQRARKRQLSHSRRDKAEARQLARRNEVDSRPRQQTRGFGMKNAQKEEQKALHL